MKIINRLPLLGILLFPGYALSETHQVACEKEKIYKGLYSKKIEETKEILETCQIPNDYLNPVCEGKGLCKPIIFASVNNLPETVKLLVEAGASINVNGGGRSGDTPLIYALMNENKELVKFLVQKGADVNQANHFGATPFWAVCAMNDLELVELFINNGADVNYGGRYPDPLKEKKEVVMGVTPLMLAAKDENIALVNLLLKYKADATYKDSLGRMAHEYTANKNIKQLLSTNEKL